MRPPNLFTNETRRQRRLCSLVRAALSIACVIAFAFTTRVKGADAPAALREKDILRAEKVLAKLRLLEEAAAARDNSRGLRALAGKFYPELFITVADMRESDLKTDLDTAVFLYERASRTQPSDGAQAVDCREERRDTYRSLCLEPGGSTVSQLLLAKARLHARWGEAVVAYHRGERSDETSRALLAMRAAREHDSAIAARVLEMLKALEGDVQTLPTYADQQEQRGLTRVSFDQLEVKLDNALGRAGALIASLPRGPAFYLLSAAWCSYRDGVFWGRQVYESRKLVVSASRFDHQDPLKELRLDADTVGHTVVVNWRKAKDYTRRAEQSLSRAATDSGLNPDEPLRAAVGR